MTVGPCRECINEDNEGKGSRLFMVSGTGSASAESTNHRKGLSARWRMQGRSKVTPNYCAAIKDHRVALTYSDRLSGNLAALILELPVIFYSRTLGGYKSDFTLGL